MKTRPIRQAAVALLCALAAALAAASPAGAALDPKVEPIFVYKPVPNPPGPPIPPPVGLFEGPCGLAVDSAGNFYVSDHYHDVVDLYTPSVGYLGQVADTDPNGRPCGLALDSGDRLYVNSYHHSVWLQGAAAPLTTADPTGVAVDPASDRVYVGERTRVSVFEPSGAPVETGGEPLRIGEGSLGDGFGVAVSAYPGTAGYVYVPDAATDTVKVYDPASDPDDPAMTIDGHETPTGGFVRLRDAAIAVDRMSGHVYVADNLQRGSAEEPETVVYVFDAAGAYLGRLKYAVIDSEPPGLAVDNSAEATQGRVYVTSGNTAYGSVYGYGPEAATSEAVPAHLNAERVFHGGGDPAGGAVLGPPCGSTCVTARSGGAKASEVGRRGSLRVSLDGKLSPRSLPRKGTAPIAVSVGWKLSTSDGSAVPDLKQVRIEINRHGRFDYAGLPTCPVNRIQPASTSRALSACRSALVGQGSFTADIALEGQERYPAHGRLLVFNGRRHGKPVLLGQIYSPRPFATSFVIVFELQRLGGGTFGTALTATLPPALASWGNLTAVEMKLQRRYHHAGSPHSFLSAGCPAPKGFPGASFPLARTSFEFAGGENLDSTLTRSCKAR